MHLLPGGKVAAARPIPSPLSLLCGLVRTRLSAAGRALHLPSLIPSPVQHGLRALGEILHLWPLELIPAFFAHFLFLPLSFSLRFPRQSIAAACAQRNLSSATESYYPVGIIRSIAYYRELHEVLTPRRPVAGRITKDYVGELTLQDDVEIDRD